MSHLRLRDGKDTGRSKKFYPGRRSPQTLLEVPVTTFVRVASRGIKFVLKEGQGRPHRLAMLDQCVGVRSGQHLEQRPRQRAAHLRGRGPSCHPPDRFEGHESGGDVWVAHSPYSKGGPTSQLKRATPPGRREVDLSVASWSELLLPVSIRHEGQLSAHRRPCAAWASLRAAAGLELASEGAWNFVGRSHEPSRFVPRFLLDTPNPPASCGICGFGVSEEVWRRRESTCWLLLKKRTYGLSDSTEPLDPHEYLGVGTKQVQRIGLLRD